MTQHEIQSAPAYPTDSSLPGVVLGFYKVQATAFAGEINIWEIGFQIRFSPCSPRPQPVIQFWFSETQRFYILEIIFEQMGIEAGGRYLLRALVICLPCFLFPQSNSSSECFSKERKEKRQHESVFRFVPCFPLKSFEVEAFRVTWKLIVNLPPGDVWGRGRCCLRGRAGLSACPQLGEAQDLLLWSQEGDSSHSLLNYKYLSKRAHS